MKLTTIFVALLSLAGSAVAEGADEYVNRIVAEAAHTTDVRYTEEKLADAEATHKRCVSASDGSMAQQGECLFRYTKDLDAIVTNNYEANLRADENSPKEVLQSQRAAQAAWRRFRQAQCAAAGARIEGGSGAGVEIGGCEARMSVARARELAEVRH